MTVDSRTIRHNHASINTTDRATISPRGKSEYVSQSEGRDAQRCHLRWFSRWPLALQNAEDSPPQRIGSIGHACLEGMTMGALGGAAATDDDLRAATLVEAKRRKWFDVDDVADFDSAPGWFEAEYQRGLGGARLIDANVARGAPVRLPCGTPLVEHRMRAVWADLVAAERTVRGQGWQAAGALARIAEGLARLGRLGIEGQPDVVHRMQRRDDYGYEYGPGTLDPFTTVFVDDYKLRQKPDLGGSLGHPDVTTTDPQGAYYYALLLATGAAGFDERVVFRQINAYAGPWLTVEDFVDERRRVQASGARGRLTIDSGLPSRDVDRMEAMVTPEVWAEAHRVLANLRHDDRRAQHEHRLALHRLDLAAHEEFKRANPKSRKQPPRAPAEPERLTAAEEQAARAFVVDLSARPLYQVQTCSLDPGACFELVRDMLAAVLSAELEHASGLPPARHFDPHPRGSCIRPYGCDLSGPCRATMASGNAESTLRDLAEQAATRRSLAVLPSGVGDDPADVE